MFVRCTNPACSCEALWNMAEGRVCDECGDYLPHKSYVEHLVKLQTAFRVLVGFLSGIGTATFVVQRAWKALEDIPSSELQVVMSTSEDEDPNALRNELKIQLERKIQLA